MAAKKAASKNKVLPALETHLTWSLQRRSDVQEQSLRLYKLMDIRATNSIGRRRRLLVGVAFSLWRAVFLAYRTGQRDLKNAEAKAFLGKILITNAIGFADDRASQEWTFRYYADSARHRLEELQEDWPTIKITMWSTSDKQFDGLFFAFKHALNLLESELNVSAGPKTPEGASGSDSGSS